MSVRKHEPVLIPEKHIRAIKKTLPSIDIAIEKMKKDALSGEFGDDARRSIEDETLLPTDLAMIALIDAFRLHRQVVEHFELYSEEDLMYFVANQRYVKPEEIVIYEAWKTCKQVYRFDPSFGEEIRRQEISETLPTSVLERMPFPLIYVDCATPLYDLTDVEGEQAAGFYAYIDKFRPLPDDKEELGFNRHPHLVCVPLTKDGLSAIVEIQLDVPTLNEAVSKYVQLSHQSFEIRSSLGLKVNEQEAKLSTDEHMRTIMTEMLNLALYLCSENADVVHGYIPAKPINSNPKKKNRRSEAIVNDVGYRIAQAVREHRSNNNGASEGFGMTMAPHIRRAHWHHFWRGPLDGERELVLRWLPPIPVNLDKGEAVPTIHLR